MNTWETVRLQGTIENTTEKYSKFLGIQSLRGKKTNIEHKCKSCSWNLQREGFKQGNAYWDESPCLHHSWIAIHTEGML